MILSNECYLTDSCLKYKNGNCDINDKQFCIKLFKIDYLYEQSLLSNSQRHNVKLRLDADGTDREAFYKLRDIQNSILEFVSNGKNLYIHSAICGNGKTEWAIKLIQSYINNIWHKSDLRCRALFINVPRFLLSLKDNISDKSDYISHIKKIVLDADLVVWDEIGVANLSKFEHEHLLNLINTRIDYDKSNIYTSNLSGDELKEKIGERLYSRVVNLSTDIEFFGSDKRGVNNK